MELTVSATSVALEVIIFLDKFKLIIFKSNDAINHLTEFQNWYAQINRASREEHR